MRTGRGVGQRFHYRKERVNKLVCSEKNLSMHRASVENTFVRFRVLNASFSALAPPLSIASRIGGFGSSALLISFYLWRSLRDVMFCR